MTDEDVARVGGPVEGALGAVLRVYDSVQGPSGVLLLLYFRKVELLMRSFFCYKVMDENPDVVQAFLGVCRAVS